MHSGHGSVSFAEARTIGDEIVVEEQKRRHNADQGERPRHQQRFGGIDANSPLVEEVIEHHDDGIVAKMEKHIDQHRF